MQAPSFPSHCHQLICDVLTRTAPQGSLASWILAARFPPLLKLWRLCRCIVQSAWFRRCLMLLAALRTAVIRMLAAEEPCCEVCLCLTFYGSLSHSFSCTPDLSVNRPMGLQQPHVRVPSPKFQSSLRADCVEQLFFETRARIQAHDLASRR